MFEQQEPEAPGLASALKLLAGVFLGFIGSILVLVAVFMAVTSGSGPETGGMWLVELLDLAVLGAGGYLTYQSMQNSSLARGLLIGISIVFLLDAICGIAMLTKGGLR